MCELCDDDRVTVVIAGEMPADEPDNAAMIARDLSDLAFRAINLAPTDDFGVSDKAVLAEMIRKAARYCDNR